ncbi:MAG: hypothetical protein WCD37_11190 [Chloroflexia bacterium]
MRAETFPADGRGSPAYWRSSWVAFLLFVALSSIFTWPLVTGLTNTLPDWADAADSTWRIGTIASHLPTDPLHLYDSPAFYPMQADLALDELLTGQGLLATPIIWLTGNPLLAYNLLNFFSYVLSGFSMWLLVRHLTGSALAGYLAGIIFAFSPWHYGQYGHLGLGAQFWMVFALLALILFLEETGQPRFPVRRGLMYLALFTLFFMLQALVAGYYAYFEAILLGLYLAYHFLFKSGLVGTLLSRLRRKPDMQPFHGRTILLQLGLLALSGIVALALLMPFVLPFVRAKSAAGFDRSLEEVAYWSAGVKSLLRTTNHSWLYEPVQVGVFGLETSAERELYPGVVALLLALVGIWGWRMWRGMPILFGLVALAGLLLSLGPTLHLDTYAQEPTGIPLPYAWLYDLVPGFDSLRVPQRFGMLFMLGLAVCAGYGLARLYRSSVPGMRTLALAAPLLAAIEFFAPGVPAVKTGYGLSAPPIYSQALGGLPAGSLLLELPVGEGEDPINTAPIYMVYGLQHRLPMLNGSSNIVPRGYDRLFYEMRRFPTPGTLDIVEALGVDYLVIHTAGLLNDEKRAALLDEEVSGERLERVATFPDYRGRTGYSDVLYRLKPDPARYTSVANLIPPGSSVLLTDQQAINRRLYTAILPYFLGSDHRYFSTYITIYDGIPGKVEPAQAGTLYDYAILYKGDDPTRFGYSPANKLDTDNSDLNDLIEVYRR